LEEGKIDEERRLFYVGMTRAQKRLFLTYPGTKVYRGKTCTVTPCPFLREILKSFLTVKLVKNRIRKKMEFIDDFFKQMKQKFAAKTERVSGLNPLE
jgi:DNA helicase-2/ATP-dependent DNA helicase PcrA